MCILIYIIFVQYFGPNRRNIGHERHKGPTIVVHLVLLDTSADHKIKLSVFVSRQFMFDI